MRSANNNDFHALFTICLQLSEPSHLFRVYPFLQEAIRWYDNLLWHIREPFRADSWINALFSSSSDHNCFRSVVNDRLLAFDYLESRWIHSVVWEDLEVSLEHLREEFSVTHKVHRQCFVLGHKDPLTTALEGIEEQVITYIVQQMAN